MDKIYNFFVFHKKNIVLFSTIFLLILFLLPIITTRRLSINKEYTKAEDVALYIIQFHELPKNYITKDDRDNGKHFGVSLYDKVIGGDSHWYDLTLDKYHIKSTDRLKECDIKDENYSLTVPNKRGQERLVYTTNKNKVRVLYTQDHYKTYHELTLFHLQIVSSVFWIIFGIYTASYITYYILILTYKKRKRNYLSYNGGNNNE